MSDKLVLRSPLNQEILEEIPYDTPREVALKVRQARESQRMWRTVELDDRIATVEAGLARLREQSDLIARDVTIQMGKPLSQARGELDTLFDRARQSIADAPAALAADVLPPKEGFVRRIEHSPLGVVFNLGAWNYPLVIPINVIVPALLAGNVVLLKHSAKTPRTGKALAAAFADLGVANLVTNLVLSHEQTEQIIESGDVNYVAFTGSVVGGQAVYRPAAEQLLGVGLELGGKDPAYVASDADLEFAVANIVDGACYNAGQSCCAVERVYVHQDRYEPFLEAAAEALRRYRLGDPLDDQTTMGPLASRSALDTLDQQISDAVTRGARVLVGGCRLADSLGNFFEPTLIADCPQDSLIMQEESFGPVLPVALVANDEEAITKMNDSRFGLTASVWTGDVARAERFGRDLEAGTIFQNRADYLDPALPWTGWKESGLGSTLSRYGFLHLTRRKSIHFRTTIGPR